MNNKTNSSTPITTHNPPATSFTHSFSQLSSITSLLGVGFAAPFKGTATEESIAAITTPGPLIQVELPPTPSSILKEYNIWTNSTNSNLIPQHLFPQWTFPPMVAALSTLPFPMTSILNQGCKLIMHGTLPINETMQVTAQLIEVTRETKKIKITTKITTSTEKNGLACTAYVYAVIPQKTKPTPSLPSTLPTPIQKRQAATVPIDSILVAEHALQHSSGRHYAYLSGDFNPIHSLEFYAKMAGFPSMILHGFAQMALTQEDIIKSRCGGNSLLLKEFDVRFVAPLVLPGKMLVWIDDVTSSVFVTSEEGVVTLIGTFVLGMYGNAKL